MSQVDVEIVLATYNGARYLSDQLTSLLGQSLPPARIIISDDGSSDQTLSIVRQFQEQHPGRIVLLTPGPGQGACANFNYLLAASEGRYVCLADQDDVWDRDKLALSMAQMQALESRWGSATPILVHTDLRVVDQALGEICPSFFKLQRLNKDRQSLKALMCQSVVTGCTVLVNRPLLDQALPIAKDAVMHDWWLSLVAAGFGYVGFIDRATMSYRQHGANTIGAKSWSPRFVLDKFKRLLNARSAADLLRPGLIQGSAFLVDYGSKLSPQMHAEVSAYASLMRATPAERLWIAVRHGFRKHGILRTLGFYWALWVADFNV